MFTLYAMAFLELAFTGTLIYALLSLTKSARIAATAYKKKVNKS
jgi:hypothetical protein